MKHPVYSPPPQLLKIVQWSGMVLLANCLAGCATLPLSRDQHAQHANQTAPQRSLNELLAHRLTLCSLDKTQRAEQIKTLRSTLFAPAQGRREQPGRRIGWPVTDQLRTGQHTGAASGGAQSSGELRPVAQRVR